ncbi:MAG: 3TM-type holin [Syntrophobacteraceae bacterium]
MFLSALPVIGKVIGRVVEVIDKMVEDKDLANKLKHDLEVQMLTQDFSFVQKEIESQAQIITAEAGGQSWLQRNWRPILMLTFTYVVAHNYIIAPIFSLTRLDVPPDMWELLKLGVGGYIVGRSVEKSVKAWKN